MRKKTLLLVGVILLALSLVEIVLRIGNYRPWAILPDGGKTWFEPSSPFLSDTLLGYKLSEGTFRVVLDEEHSFVSVQNRYGRRITSFTDTGVQIRSGKHIHILGDSFTFGSFMDDSVTYPWLLQRIIPNYRVKNYAVPGYGVSNVFVQLRTIDVDSGDIVLYAYFAQHNNRYERRILKMMYGRDDLIGSIGYILLDDSLQSTYQEYDYRVWTLSHYSALFNLLEDQYNSFIDDGANKLAESIAVKAVKKMSDKCKNKGATFVLVGVMDNAETQNMLQTFRQEGVECVDVSVDLNDPRYYSLPNDRHPNATANKIFASKIYSYLTNQNILDSSNTIHHTIN